MTVQQQGNQINRRMNFSSSLDKIITDLRSAIKAARKIDLTKRAILRGYVETGEKYLLAFDKGTRDLPDRKEIARISKMISQATPKTS